MPPVGAEQSRDLAGKSTVGDEGDALSDARGVLCQVDDARLVALIEQWPTLSDRVKGEILKLAEYDQTTEVNA